MWVVVLLAGVQLGGVGSAAAPQRTAQLAAGADQNGEAATCPLKLAPDVKSWTDSNVCSVDGSTGSASGSSAQEYSETWQGDQPSKIVASGAGYSTAEWTGPEAGRYGASGIAGYGLQFTLSGAAVITFSGSLSASGPGPFTRCAYVQLTHGAPTYSTIYLQSSSASAGACTGDPTSVDVQHEELVPAGDYLLQLQATTAATASNPEAGYPTAADTMASYDLTVRFGPGCDNEFTDGPDTITGTEGDDVLCGGPGADHIDGLGGADTIYGGAGADTLDAGGGEDTVFGEAGANTILGGAEGDLLVGAGDIDDIAGQGGDDVIHGAGSGDLLDGGAGDDSVFAGSGGDVVTGGDGQDKLRGEGGGDKVYGGEKHDVLSGGGGTDTLAGEGGPDHLVGGDRRDHLAGGPGEDRLDGGGGNDQLSGGDGLNDLHGDGGDDRLQGGRLVDRMFGGADNDVLIGAGDPDVFSGDGGDDLLKMCDGVEDLNGDGGPGHDTSYRDPGDPQQSVEVKHGC